MFQSNYDIGGVTIGVMFYQRALLTRFEQYLYHSLHRLIMRVHDMLSLQVPGNTPDVYYYTSLIKSGRLELFGPYQQNGFTKDVFLIAVPKRKLQDRTWKGNLQTPEIFEVGASRARSRLHRLCPLITNDNNGHDDDDDGHHNDNQGTRSRCH